MIFFRLKHFELKFFICLSLLFYFYSFVLYIFKNNLLDIFGLISESVT